MGIKADAQINGTEIKSPEVNPRMYSQFMTKEAGIYNGVKTDSSINGVGKTGQTQAKE